MLEDMPRSLLTMQCAQSLRFKHRELRVLPLFELAGRSLATPRATTLTRSESEM